MNYYYNCKGFAALFTIVVVSAAVLILSMGAAMLGLGELDQGYTNQKGQEAFAVADGCMEEAMRRLRLNANYSGNPSLEVLNGNCSISVIDPSPVSNQRVITILGTVENFSKKIETEITLSTAPLPVITVTNWQELDD